MCRSDAVIYLGLCYILRITYNYSPMRSGRENDTFRSILRAVMVRRITMSPSTRTLGGYGNPPPNAFCRTWIISVLAFPSVFCFANRGLSTAEDVYLHRKDLLFASIGTLNTYAVREGRPVNERNTEEHIVRTYSMEQSPS
jgi:hypothetical protein